MKRARSLHGSVVHVMRKGRSLCGLLDKAKRLVPTDEEATCQKCVRFAELPEKRSYRRSLPAPTIEKVWSRADGCCELCGRKLSRYRVSYGIMSDKVTGHIDHIVPKSKGGSDDHHNLRLICAHSNLSRGDGTQDAMRMCA